jgi:hypothetical protein
LKMKAVAFLETSVNTNPASQSHIAVLIPKQNLCGNVKCKKFYISFPWIQWFVLLRQALYLLRYVDQLLVLVLVFRITL